MAKTPPLHPLRAYRVTHGLSCDVLAKQLGIAETTLRSLENGNREITAEKAVDIESRIGIDRAALRPDLFQRAAA